MQRRISHVQLTLSSALAHAEPAQLEPQAVGVV